jgi:hypothetical protein
MPARSALVVSANDPGSASADGTSASPAALQSTPPAALQSPFTTASALCVFREPPLPELPEEEFAEYPVLLEPLAAVVVTAVLFATAVEL